LFDERRRLWRLGWAELGRAEEESRGWLEGGPPVMKKKRSLKNGNNNRDDTVACYAGINVSVRQVGVSGWAGVFGCHLRCLQGLI
jgi:hypothetical protein